MGIIILTMKKSIFTLIVVVVLIPGLALYLIGVEYLLIAFFILLSLLLLAWLFEKSKLFWIASKAGKTCQWLDEGWRPPLVMLFDVALFVVALRGSFLSLADLLLPKMLKLNAEATSTILFNRSPFGLSNVSPIIKSNVSPIFYNATIAANGTFNETLVNGTVSIGTFHEGIFTKLFSHEGFLIHGGFVDSSLLDRILALVLDTLWFHWQDILLFWFLLEILQMAVRASGRLSINFEQTGTGSAPGGSNNEKSTGMPPSVEGLTDLLVLHLNRINELYRVVDEERAIPSASGPGRPVDANIKTDESELIPENTDQSFKLWNIQIPVNLILRLAVRLMNGPRITVSLQKQADGKRFLVANMVGRRGSQSWLVESTDAFPEESLSDKQPREVEDMVKELAYRIHAFLAFGDADRVSKWRARYKFAEGLRFYRDALVSTGSRYYNLKLAEENFVGSIEEDNSFALAYYNLGVVYTELGQMEAANSAFNKALEFDSGMAEAYYALGLNIYSMAECCEKDLCRLYKKIPDRCTDARSYIQLAEMFFKHRTTVPFHSQRRLVLEYGKVVSLCDHVIDLLQTRAGPLHRDYEKLAHAYNLKANAKRHLAALWMNEKLSDSEKGRGKLEESLRDNEMAVRYSWLELLLSSIFERNLDTERSLVVENSLDLSYAYIDKIVYSDGAALIHLSRAENELLQARNVGPMNVDLQYYLSGIYFINSLYLAAEGEMKKAIEMEPENSNLWAHLALILAHNSDEGSRIRAVLACDEVKLYGPGASSQALETAEDAYLEMGMNKSAERLRRAAFKIDLESYWKERLSTGKRGRTIRLEDAQIFFHINELLYVYKYKLNIEAHESDWWCYAQLAIAFEHLSHCLGKYESESLDYVRDAISQAKSECSSRKSGCMLSSIQHKLALGTLELACSQKEVAEETFQGIRAEIEAKKEEYIHTYKNTTINRGGRWEVYIIDLSHVLVEIGQLHLKESPQAAAEWFQQAISLLELDFQSEIKRLRLHALKSEALRKSDKYRSLKQARKGQILDPLDREVGKMTGEAYCSLRDFDKATDYFKRVQSLDPDNPDILMDLGALQLRKAMASFEDDERNTALKNALQSFGQAWKLYDRDDLTKRGEARYCIARTYMEEGRPEKAVRHLTVVYKAKYGDPVEKEKDPRWLLVGLQLGKAYLRVKAYDCAESLFREIIRESLARIEQTGNVREMIGYHPTETMALGDLLAYSKIHLAAVYHAKGVDLDKALRELEGVEVLGSAFAGVDLTHLDGDIQSLHLRLLVNSVRYGGGGENEDPLRHTYDRLSLLENVVSDRAMSSLPPSGKETQAALWDCKGWILYDQARLFGKNTLDNAAHLLQKSAGLKADPVTYLHLAQVYALKFTRTKDEMWLERAKAIYKNAEGLDLRKENKDDLRDLKERLFGKEKPPGPEKDSMSMSTIKLDGTLGATLSYADPKKEKQKE